MFRVRVRDDCRWPVAVVDGVQFTRSPREMAEVSDEIRRSPLLDVEEIEEEEADDTDGDDSGDNKRRGRRRNG
jgi:hypothetical protein